jgi:bacillithiol synthase
VQDYLDESPRILPLFNGSFRASESYRAQARHLSERFDRDALREAAGAVRAPTPEARERLERLVEEGGCFVTTGQQPGLFTGPLYAVYKALTAVRLAAELEPLLERPVLPLFWIASEDHDWAEVNHTWVVDLENELRRIEVGAKRDGANPPPIHRIPLDGDEKGGPAGIAATIDALAALLPETDFREDCLRILRESYPAGCTLASGFQAVLEELLAPFGLLFVDAADPVLKGLSRPVLEKELTAAETHERILADGAAALEAAEYPVQVPILAGGVNLFLEAGHGRERVYRSGAGFRLRHSGAELSAAEVADIVAEDPSRISPNVLLRPVVENHVFPVVSVVAGPGETGYYAQLGALFRAHGLRMPVVHPRFGVTLVESKIGKVLDKFGLEPSALERPHHEVAGELLREEMPAGVRRALGELRGALGGGLGRLLKEARTIDPTLKGPVDHARTTAMSALDDVEKKIVQSLKRENEIALGQLEKARVHLFPDGKPQERVLNVFPYLARYGRELIPHVADRFAIELEANAPGGVG